MKWLKLIYTMNRLEMINVKLISACLCGINCKYNGTNNSHPYFLELLKQGELLPICPEQLGGLPTPRSACEIMGGSGAEVIQGNAQVINKTGENLRSVFIKGAHESLQLAKQADISEAILQSRSPSCGCGKIYDGTFTGKLITGDGVTAALLKMNGIKVWNDEAFKERVI